METGNGLGWAAGTLRWARRLFGLGGLAVRLDRLERRLAALEADLTAATQDGRPKCLTCGTGRMALLAESSTATVTGANRTFTRSWRCTACAAARQTVTRE